MSVKTTEPKPAVQGFRYTEEDLAPRDLAADEAAMDAFLERNKDAINAGVKLADEQFARGEYFTEAEVFAYLEAEALRRRNVK